MIDLKTLSYEELCEKLHNSEIGYLEFVKNQDEELANLYTSTMKFYGLEESDTTAKAFLEHHEETLRDTAEADEVLPAL
jgi:hypothetical protein